MTINLNKSSHTSSETQKVRNMREYNSQLHCGVDDANSEINKHPSPAQPSPRMCLYFELILRHMTRFGYRKL